MTLIRSVAGVRGIVPRDLNAEIARRYARAFGEMTGGGIAVGWDSRPGGDELERAVMAGLADSGASPVRLGIVPTPTVGIAVRTLGCAGGVCITASHNPGEYNGLKFFSATGVFVTCEEGERIFERADALGKRADALGKRADALGKRADADRDSGAVRIVPADGESESVDAVETHIGLVLASQHVDADAIAAAAPVVVVDCVNASGSVILPELLRRLGCDVVELYSEAGAGFPRVAEPVPESLGVLGERVRETGAAAGFACDPDADRLAIVDETGRAIGEEYTLALATDAVLSLEKGPVVTNVSTSRMIDDVAERHGAVVHRTAVGEANVVSKMIEVSAVVGGEGNGGVVLPGVHLGRDAATAVALIVSHMARRGVHVIGELVQELKPYAIVKRKLPTGIQSGDALEATLVSEFAGGSIDRTDGVKISWADSWVHVRPSNTEPIVRVIAEAPDVDGAEALATRAEQALAESGEGSA